MEERLLVLALKMFKRGSNPVPKPSKEPPNEIILLSGRARSVGYQYFDGNLIGRVRQPFCTHKNDFMQREDTGDGRLEVVA